MLNITTVAVRCRNLIQIVFCRDREEGNRVLVLTGFKGQCVLCVVGGFLFPFQRVHQAQFCYNLAAACHHIGREPSACFQVNAYDIAFAIAFEDAVAGGVLPCVVITADLVHIFKVRRCGDNGIDFGV